MKYTNESWNKSRILGGLLFVLIILSGACPCLAEDSLHAIDSQPSDNSSAVAEANPAQPEKGYKACTWTEAEAGGGPKPEKDLGGNWDCRGRVQCKLEGRDVWFTTICKAVDENTCPSATECANGTL